jgi:hypothetical protein
MIEINYYKTSTSGRELRRQLLQVPDGWTLSNAVEVGEGPESLRGYEGGWEFLSTVYETRAKAEKALRQNRWHLEGEAQPAEASRNRTRAARAASGAVAIEVQLTVEQRDALDAEARSRGISRTALVAKYADSLSRRNGKNKTTGKVKK